MLAYTTEDGSRKMDRLVANDAAQSVEQGKRRLESNEMDAIDAVLLYDARIPLQDRKSDAIIAELRAYFSPDSVAMIAVPYTPKDNGAFRVHRPKVLVWESCEDFDLDAAMESFWQGVDEHEEGAKVWNSHLDQST
ncbi:MAG TPA: hypothetical protein VFV87_19895 [Pirellulaceae bacterium]|nr:hypothetical protein [Pirellulaceae bacterium]